MNTFSLPKHALTVTPGVLSDDAYYMEEDDKVHLLGHFRRGDGERFAPGQVHVLGSFADGEWNARYMAKTRVGGIVDGRHEWVALYITRDGRLEAACRTEVEEIYFSITTVHRP